MVSAPVSSPSYVGSDHSGWVASGTSITIDKPSGLVSGDIMLGWIDKDDSTNVTPPAGWTLAIANRFGTTYNGELFYKFADAGDVAASDFTFTNGTNCTTCFGLIIAYRNVSTSIPFDFTSGFADSAGSVTHKGGVTHGSNRRIVAFTSSTTGPGTPTGFTSRIYDGTIVSRISDKEEASATTVAEFTVTGSASYNTATVALNPTDATDPCNSSPSIGDTCAGGAIYAGTWDDGAYMIVPGDCIDSRAPYCDGTTDSLTKSWRGSSGSNADIVGVENLPSTSHVNSEIQRGYIETPLIAADASTSADSAADYCNDLVYGGYDDWAIGNKAEMAYIMCKSNIPSHNTSNPQEDPNCANRGGKTSELTDFDSSWQYWTTTEANSSTAYHMNFNNGEASGAPKSFASLHVRCIRRYDDVKPLIDWPNFDGESSTQTFLDITETINVQISPANTVGTPTMEYNHNSGGWTALTAGSPITLSNVARNDTLQFRVAGTVGHQGTFTIANLSDGGANIDTIIGTVSVCNGYLNNGICWHYGPVGEDCNTTCNIQGKTCNITNTRTISKDTTECENTIVGLFNSVVSGNSSGTSYDYACATNLAGSHRATMNGAGDINDVTCTTTNFESRRICACDGLVSSPNPFDFTDNGGANPGVMVNSDIVQITGTGGPWIINEMTMGEYRVCSDAICTSIVTDWTSNLGSISNNQYLQVRQAADGYPAGIRTMDVLIQGTSADWTVTSHNIDYVYNDVVLLIQPDAADLTIDDDSTHSHTVTALANAALSTAVTDPFGGGRKVVVLDGTDDGLSVPDDNAFDMGGNDYTMEAWYYFDALDANGTYTIIKPNGLSAGPGINILNGSDAGLYFYYSYAPTAGVTLDENADRTSPLSTWVHIAASRSGNYEGFFINGVEINNTRHPQVKEAMTDALIIGGGHTFGDDVDGYVTGVRVINGVGAYNGNFTPPSGPYSTTVDSNDLTPNGYDFTDSTSVTATTTIASNIVQVTGIDSVATVTVSGDPGSEFRVCSASDCSSVVHAWTSESKSISNNQWLQVRVVSGLVYPMERTVTVNVGFGSEDFMTRVAAGSDVTLDPMDWLDFTRISSAEVFTWIDNSINVQITATQTSGTPTMEYRVNGGSWTGLTHATPAVVGINPLDTMEFRVTGTGGHTADFVTVNQTDGNAPIDTVTGTVFTCAGYTDTGYCYHLGSLNENCNTVCGNLGLNCDLSGTRAGATDLKCDPILTGLGVSTFSGSENSVNDYACSTDSIGFVYKANDTTSLVTCEAFDSDERRSCACEHGPPDPTVNAVDWADFTNISSVQTITGINMSINLEFSVVHGTGTPTVEYSKNGGAWTAFTPGSPATVPTVNGDDYDFRISGTNGNTATITVTNLTDGSTVLDTMLATYLDDFTPDAIDWANFSNNSTVATINGINQSINLELSTVYGTGTPTIEYQKNALSWTAFTPGSPATVSFDETDTLAFRVSGTNTHSATITVTNLSDSSTVIDTTVGTVQACTGYEEGGYCWYLGDAAESCDTACSDESLTCDLNGILNYTGSAGTDGQCESVLDGLAASGTGAPNAEATAVGCNWDTAKKGDRGRGTNATTCAASAAGIQRACACYTPVSDPTPDAINWADFNDSSTTETVTGINTSINLELSAAYGTGTPTIEYSHNAGAWTGFTPGSPANISVSNNDTLAFKVLGAIGHTATITVTNTSDSNTVLDTAVGTVTVLAPIVTTLTSGTSWTVPANWNPSNNTIECIGGGGRGQVGSTFNGGRGGGGGAYARLENVDFSGNISYSLGAGGTSGSENGGDTWFINSTSLLAKGGTAGPSGGTGGSVAESVGDTIYAGGDGGPGNAGGGGGGGGAAGESGAGSNGVNGDPGAGGAGNGANSGAGGNSGNDFDPALPGNNYGGGGGGGGWGFVTAQGDGAPGICVITYSPAASTCGGSEVGGHCWYSGVAGDSCDQTCTTNGLTCDLTGTRDYAGSAGSDANCEAVLDALGLDSGSIDSNAGGTGCALRNTGTLRYRGTGTATTCANATADYVRACACEDTAPDVTPAAMDWADFENNSSIKTILGIDTTINLELSAVYGTGTPTIEYRKNAGSWTAFTPGSPATVGFDSTDTLQFRVSGTDAETATITVTNTSDGNAVLDTVVGTVEYCTGYKEGGFCWYYGASGESCDTVCTNQGGSCELNGILNYTGSSGTNGQCESVLDALSAGGTGAPGTQGNAHGCAYQTNKGGNRRRGTSATTCASSDGNYQRACSCDMSPDFTPSAVDWKDFAPLTLTQTLVGFNQTIDLELSAVYDSGTPTIEYNKNSGGWVAFSPGSPATVSFVSNDTLAFRVSGTNGHSATITVTNTSDSNTVIDTVSGTVQPNPAFFVMSGSSTDGNMGGLSGADATCLSELQTNDWLGKSIAGTLTAARVKAFLCDSAGCNNLQPNTIYFYARSGSSTTGGDSFLTNGSGQGPGDTLTWNISTKLGANYSTWFARAQGSNSLWSNSRDNSHCSNWSTTTGNGRFGNTGSSDYHRWRTNNGSCASNFRLICYVDP